MKVLHPELLVCPSCRGPLSPEEGSQGLRCPACGIAYPVDRGALILTASSIAFLSVSLMTLGTP